MIVTNHLEIIKAQEKLNSFNDRAVRPDEIFKFIDCLITDGKSINEIHNRLLRLIKLSELQKAAMLTSYIEGCAKREHYESSQIMAITRVAFKILHRIMTQPEYRAA